MISNAFRLPPGPFALALTCLAMTASLASADTVLSLNQPNSTLSSYPGPFGSVDISLTDSTHATVTFTAQGVSGSYYYLFGDGNSIDLNANASSFTASITGTAANGGVVGFNSGSAQNVSTFGLFNLSYDNDQGGANGNPGHYLTSATVSLHNLSGSWATSDDVLKLTNQGYYAAVHSYVYDSSDSTSHRPTALNTGFVGDGGIQTLVVPEPTSIVIALTGIGALGVGRMTRRLRRVS